MSKLREYRQMVRRAFGEQGWRPTVGYPCPLPLFPTQFAMVRPPDELFDHDTYHKSRWQVIHIASGHRLSRFSSSSRTQLEAKMSAMAELECAFKKYGKRKVFAKVGKCPTP